MKYLKHKTAEVSSLAKVGENTKIWMNAQIRERANIGRNCNIGKNVYIGAGVKIGDNVKIQNNTSVFEGLSIEDGVFIGPHVVFANDKYPRAIKDDGSIKKIIDWKMEKSLVKYGASIGANATILPGITIGEYAMVGAGAVVTKNVPDFALVIGNPAKIVGKVDKNGKIIK